VDSSEDVLSFWFPPGAETDEAGVRAQLERWFRGGTDAEIGRRFPATAEAAARGELDAWAATPRGLLALVLVLDQFSRSLYRDTPRAFAQDPRAQSLAREAIERGWHLGLEPWEATFLAVALGHSEHLALHDLGIAALEERTPDVPAEQASMWQHNLSQARAHREVIRRFGRHPHRNAVLGRTSTPEEEAYLASETPPHRRELPAEPGSRRSH
jgi:uncharacterized protein (DUF924 family)